MRNTELLIPASSLEVLKTAVLYGADAVYIGGEMYGLRAKARNFSREDMEAGIKFAHENGVKVYVTANIVAHNEDLEGIREYFRELKEIGPDALIISDPGVFMIAKEECPDIERHISTQANSTNYATYNFWYAQGASRVVAARELSLKELSEIRANIPENMEIEACTHPCRWKYYVMEESRPGEYLPVEENERGTYIFNSKDLCMIEHIPDLLEAGVDSLKIEGRMKTALYVAAVTRTYRRAIDDYKTSPELFEKNLDYYRKEIAKCTYRQFTTGFYYGKTDENSQIYDANTYIKEYTYIGIVQDVDENGWCKIYQRNKFSVGETIEVMIPDGSNRNLKVLGMEDEDRHAVESAPHPKQEIWINFGEALEKGYLLRRKE